MNPAHPEPSNLIGTWSHLLMDAFARSGVSDVVVTPGSRSTPFVLAAVRHSGLRCVSLVDERVAAFHALGMAKATGRPVILLCTSGTAPAHYLPAVIEASLCHAPLIVLSADRPESLQDCGAPQTIDQVKLFGDHARWFVDLGEPQWSPGALRALRRKAVQAIARSLHPTPGAVHVNARAAKPLEPRPASPEETPSALQALRILEEPLTRAHLPQSVASREAIADLGGLLASCKRGMIVAGPAPLSQRSEREQVMAFARHSGFALLAEATSQLRLAGRPDGVLAFDAFDTVLRASRAAEQLRPDVIVQLGPAPTSGAFERWLAWQDAPRIVIAPYGWQDPSSSAAHLVSAPVGTTLASLLAVLPAMTPERPWRDHVARWDTLAWSWAERLSRDEEGLSEAACVRAVLDEVPAGGLLGVGNSLPVRLMDTWCPGGCADVAVFSQRGANGIDGMVAGFSGAASASGSPGVLLLGDVTLTHDLAGLSAARQAREPLIVVAINNGGGRIFEQLPIAALPGIERDFGFWTTPPAIDFEKAAGAFGVAYCKVGQARELRQAMREAARAGGCTLVEAVVPPSGALQRNRRLWAAVEQEQVP